MNEEEKKAIKFLKETEFDYLEYDMCVKSVGTVLRLIEKLQKENEELKNQEATARKINELLVQRYSNSISVQTVKDKIAELKVQYKTALEENSTEAFILKCQITILQELIEEREEKKNGENI